MARCWLARRLHQIKASTTMDLRISIFLIFVRCVALRKQYRLERNLSALLLRMLAVGRRQQSESIEAALDMELGGLVPLLVELHNVLSRFGSLLVWVATCHHDVTR